MFIRPLSLIILTALLVSSLECNKSNDDGTAETNQQGVFVDVTKLAGFDYAHGLDRKATTESMKISGGAAAGDYDRDGWVDIYVVRGNVGPNLLFRNRGDGTFEEVGKEAGVDVTGAFGSGPTFADYDGDGWLDLFIGGVQGTEPRLFRNLGDGTFEDVTTQSGLIVTVKTFSAAFGDYDRDGDLDLYLTHWIASPPIEYLWRNNGDGTFTDVTAESGVDVLTVTPFLFGSFTPNFADIDNDGLPDLLVAADFGTSQVFLNQGDGTFFNVTSSVITDENGMGASVEDYDNDGDLDWFVTSILDPNGVPEGNWGISGNRLYRNLGDGTFEDTTDEAGVRNGFWGWGSCFADFDNDGNLDIFHVNGWPPRDPAVETEFSHDPSRLFISNGDGTFRERAAELGIDDTKQGRGVVCFDYDRDGDVDIFIANNGQPPRLYSNNLGNALNFINIRLAGLPPNTEAIGARVFVTIGGETQMRELSAGSNFESQNPVEEHFGLGSAGAADEVLVLWPDGETTTLSNVEANRFLVLSHPSLQ